MRRRITQDAITARIKRAEEQNLGITYVTGNFFAGEVGVVMIDKDGGKFRTTAIHLGVKHVIEDIFGWDSHAACVHQYVRTVQEFREVLLGWGYFRAWTRGP